MPPIIHETFNPVTVPLEQHNLIEASAGTGKTYSIALLVLRLIIQKGYSIDQILMVTFTKDAAAEMELRVREFMRIALDAASGRDATTDQNIVQILFDFKDNELAAQRLQQELGRFDKAAIFTIHGFCARTLAEFAFEASQLFGASTMEPDRFDLLLEDAFNQAWRNYFTILEPEVLNYFFERGYNRKLLLELIKGQLNGKQLYLPEGQNGDLDAIIRQQRVIEETNEALHNLLIERIPIWKNDQQRFKKSAKTHLWPIIEAGDVEALFEKVLDGKECKTYIIESIDSDIIDLAEQRKVEMERQCLFIRAAFTARAIECCNYVQQRLLEIRLAEGQITFDDMIAELHAAVCGFPNNQTEVGTALAATIRARFRAVFIDEFQDTDKLQYELFAKVFQNPAVNSNHTVFYIGDPKQSIYAFRKADLQTYFNARNSVDHLHRMNFNYRSSVQYISAMNEFFQPEDNFDIFNSGDMRYYPVASPEGSVKNGTIYFDGNPIAAMRILGCKTKGKILYAVADLVRKWLYDAQYTFVKDGQSSRIRPAQIGILVRTKKEGRQLRSLLAKQQIPAITVADSKVFETEEAIELIYLLQAILDIRTGTIRKALLTQSAGYSWRQLLQLNEEQLLGQFRSYQEVWKSKGIYVMLRQVLRDWQVVQRRWDRTWPNADRHLSNLFQLMEMLHTAEQERNYKPNQLLAWLQRGIEGDFSNGSDYLQRIESDEQAVKIVTIHSSKGLEYDLVIAPFLDMPIKQKIKTRSLYLDGKYYTADISLLEPARLAISQHQEAQENMRLLYVAITRARFHACLFTAFTATEDASLQIILKPLLQLNKPLQQIRLIAMDEMKPEFMNSTLLDQIVERPPSEVSQEITVPEVLPTFPLTPRISLPDLYWQKTSYSGLNPSHSLMTRSFDALADDPYDQFIFKTLRKGAQSGNLLHDLFEHIDFSQDTYWDNAIFRTIERYPASGLKAEHKHNMRQFLETILECNLPGASLSLNQVTRQQRLSELEFDLPLASIDWDSFPRYLESDNIRLNIRQDTPLTGILNGKIDLFFEHAGKYYLLDWKSNHLGNSAADYHADAVRAAMENNNYYLQYYFYCLALYRYLRLRQPDFDYEAQFGGVYYLFVRGMRTNSDTGIYFHKPRLEDLMRLEERLLLNVNGK